MIAAMKKPTPRLRPTHPDDVSALIALQRRVYPYIPHWTEKKFHNQLEVFPQGQIMVELEGRPVGCAGSMIVSWDEWAGPHTWKEITASGTFDNHNPEGRTLYGAEVFVDPDLRGHGLGHLLYDGRKALCRAMNLKRIIACGRLPGYHKHADTLTPEQYAQKVVWGDFRDPVLGFQMHEGFHYCGVIEGYIPEDKESLGNASLIVWLNTHYDPDRPTLFPEGDVS